MALKRVLSALVVTVALGVSIAFVGCSMPEATGYQGDLEDGSEFVYIELSDNAVMVSIVDDEHQGDDAETYSGKAEKSSTGEITVKDDESGKSITFTLTENSDGTRTANVEGHGTGTLTPYEGDILEVISSMADDDADDENSDESSNDSESK